MSHWEPRFLLVWTEERDDVLTKTISLAGSGSSTAIQITIQMAKCNETDVTAEYCLGVTSN